MTGRVFSLRVEIEVPSGRLEDAQAAIHELLPTRQTVFIEDESREIEVTITARNEKVQVLVG